MLRHFNLFPPVIRRPIRYVSLNRLYLIAALFICNVLVACGGSGSPDTSLDTEPSVNAVIEGLSIKNISTSTATISFSTSLARAARLKIWLDSDGPNQPPLLTLDSPVTTEHELPVSGLWSATPWRVEVSVDDDTEIMAFETADPLWASEPCRSGDIALPISGSAPWANFSDANGSVIVTSTLGCEGLGRAARFTFDLGEGEWVVAQSENYATPIDLTAYTHLWIPFRGTPNIPVALEVKLRDDTGGLSVVRLDGGVSVPVWRSWAVDMREFTAQIGDLDLSSVVGVEVAFSWPKNEAGARNGVLEMADLQAWNMIQKRPQVTGFERTVRDEVAMAEVAADLLARQQDHSFINAWFELEPNLHLYANAMALIVFTLEYERLEATSDVLAEVYLSAAMNMAETLVALQMISDRGGAWDDSFIDVDGVIARREPGSRIVWVGSTAWAGISLLIARDILPDGGDFDPAISAAASYYLNQQDCRTRAGLPSGSLAEGTEGNISSHLFLAAAAKRGLASTSVTDDLGRFISDHLFDPVQQRFFCGISVDFGNGFDESACTLNGSGAILGVDAHSCLDVVANWGTEWLLRAGRTQDALAGLAYGRFMFPAQSFGDPLVKGLGDIAGPWTPTVEHGAGQWAAAGGPDSNYVMRQAQIHLCSAGSCQGAADDLFTGISWNSKSTGVSPAAWMYIAWHGEFWKRL
jgi:hypothetical protein